MYIRLIRLELYVFNIIKLISIAIIILQHGREQYIDVVISMGRSVTGKCNVSLLLASADKVVSKESELRTSQREGLDAGRDSYLGSCKLEL